MAYARDAETIGLLFKALVQQRCPTVSLLAQRLGAPYGPPLLVALGMKDDPRSRWAEVEEIVGWLQLAAQVADPARNDGKSWEGMTEQERVAWLRDAQTTPN